MVSPFVRHNPRVLYTTCWPESISTRTKVRHSELTSSVGGRVYALRLEALNRSGCRGLKEVLLKAGGRLVHHRNGTKPQTMLLISRQGMETLATLSKTTTGLEGISEAMKKTLWNYERVSFTVPHSKGLLKLGRKTCVMGILNVTPDSFYDGGRFQTLKRALNHAHTMIKEGADIIDIGGVSTRPGSKAIPLEEELRRVIPVVKELSRQTNRPISVDTYRASVAKKALASGAQMINDISGLDDPDMAKAVASYGAPLVIMHIKGSPHRIQKRPVYKDLLREIMSFLRKKVEKALDAGLKESSIIIDPGIGFGKGPEQSLEVLQGLEQLRSLGLPIMVGTSRKSFIGSGLGLSPEERLPGTLATLAMAILKGAKIVRVHDVREAVQLAAICDATKGEQWRSS
ncbi:MAG TPA: dihydropteroate synthase [Candidatus Hypogeohydataceae bacterium YC38]